MNKNFPLRLSTEEHFLLKCAMYQTGAKNFQELFTIFAAGLGNTQKGRSILNSKELGMQEITIMRRGISKLRKLDKDRLTKALWRKIKYSS